MSDWSLVMLGIEIMYIGERHKYWDRADTEIQGLYELAQSQFPGPHTSE